MATRRYSLTTTLNGRPVRRDSACSRVATSSSSVRVVLIIVMLQKKHHDVELTELSGCSARDVAPRVDQSWIESTLLGSMTCGNSPSPGIFESEPERSGRIELVGVSGSVLAFFRVFEYYRVLEVADKSGDFPAAGTRRLVRQERIRHGVALLARVGK